MSRTFTIHNVTKIDGCPTKKPRHSRYFNEDPMSAAKKAHTVLCNRKRIHGSCTLIITMRETTSGSAKKLFTYIKLSMKNKQSHFVKKKKKN